MRILVVTQYFWPENFRINDLAAELVRRGHGVTVLTGLPNYPGGTLFPGFAADRASYASFAGAEVVRVPLILRGRGRGIRLIANYLSFAASASALGVWRLKGRQFDVVFVYEPSPITVGLPAVLLGWLKRAPVTLWVLDLWPETLAALGVTRSRWALSAVSKVVRFIYDRCALVLVQSRAFIPAVMRHSGRSGASERTRYFPSWSEDLGQHESVAPAPEISWRPDLFTVLFAGNVGEAQDFPAIVSAAERLKDDERVRWIIVGDGRMSRWVEDEVTRRGLRDRVSLAGRFPLDRMPSFFRHADALLVSLRADPVFALTIPGKIQSYLQAGIPILAMLDGEGARVVEESGAGVTCRSGDSAGLASAVRAVAALSQGERHAMGRRGANYAAREFGRDDLIARLESLLEESRKGGRISSSPAPSLKTSSASTRGPDA